MSVDVQDNKQEKQANELDRLVHLISECVVIKTQLQDSVEAVENDAAALKKEPMSFEVES